ncbi:MAG: hypothetical protein O9282_06110 [Flavobacterium sp.]|uniref:hypothetical protein n=1 Tax=Flavobacterium sp. TaxID=239 RepID=UPI0022BCB891|nr:hypothetical protein [Flavobacterium sp.]MCZ8330868.1 hypothetical protein [Flavobacterium sp.]
MKKKYISFVLIFLTQLCAFAQEWTGTFNTKYGDLKLVTENGIIYGDYANGGTILAVEKKFNGGSRLCGLFHNGADRGKFYFEKTTSSKNIRGHFNYDNNITLNDIVNDALFTMKFDFDAKWLWDGTKANNTSPTDTKTAVFNGLWNTTDGNLMLQQVGNKVTGTYKNIGTVDGIYTPQTKKLKGTFYNNNTKKTGHFEFDFEGNTFKGKWGWTAAMTDGSWNGTKNVKNNKVLVTASTAATNNTATTRFTVSSVNIETSNDNIYGFWGFKLFKVTASGRQQVQNFGNKPSDVYNQTENGSKIITSKNHNFPNSPEFFREFIITNADLNNSSIKYELEVYVHAKNKRVGTNIDYGMKKEIYRLDTIEFNKNIKIPFSADGTTIFTSGIGSYTFKITKS